MPWVPVTPDASGATPAPLAPPVAAPKGRWVPVAPAGTPKAAAKSGGLDIDAVRQQLYAGQNPIDVAVSAGLSDPAKSAAFKAVAEHPYITAAATGLLDPELAAGEGAEAAVPLIKSGLRLGERALGAGKQMLATGASDMAQRLVDPDQHPYLSAAAGLLAPLATEGVTRKITPEATAAFARDDKSIKAAADRAYTKTEAENATAREAAESRAQTEQKSEETKAQKAAEKQAAQNRAENQDVYAKTVKAQQRFDDVRTEADRTTKQQTQALAQQIATEHLPEAKQAALRAAAGPAPFDVTMGPGPERDARDAQLRQDIMGPLQSYRKDWAQRRDAITQSHLDEAVDEKPMTQVALDEKNKWAKTQAPLSPHVQQMLDQFVPAVTDEQARALWEGQAPMGVQKRYERLISEATAQPGAKVDYRAIMEQAYHAPKTVADYLKIQAQANDLARASQGPDRVAAQKVVHGIDDVLESTLPGYKDLRREYAGHRNRFDYAFEDKLRETARPVEMAPELFNQPERTLDLLHHGDEQTRRALGNLYAEWVETKGPGVISQDQAPALAKLYPGTPFADPKAWIFEKSAENHLAEVISSSPEVKAKFQQEMQNAQQQLAMEVARPLVRDAFRGLKEFGNLGLRVETQMRQTKDVLEQARIAAKFFDTVTPSEAVDANKSGQLQPETAARHARMAHPTDARQAAQAFQGEDADEAAIKAIQKGYSEDTRRDWHGLKNKGKLYLMVDAGMAFMGRVSGYAGMGTAWVAMNALREHFVKAQYEALRDPATARAWYQNMRNPGTPKALRSIADMMLRAELAQVTAKLGIDAEKQNQPAPTATTGRGVSVLQRLKAEQIAPTPSGADRAQKLDKKLAQGGKPPNIQQDLATGRLSLDETKKLLAGTAQSDLKALVANVPLPEAMAAAEVGTASEKALLTPLLKERMQAEMPKMQNKTMQAKLAQRLAALSKSEGTPDNA